MVDKVIDLTSSRAFQDIGTIGQTPAQLAGNVQSINAILDVGLRNTKNLSSSFVRVEDLVGLGFVTLKGSQLFAAPQSGGAGTVTVQYSISGDGSSGSPLQLVNDTATPGANMVYGTDGSGVRGWQAVGAGSSPLTTKGDLFGFDTADNRIPVGTDGDVLTADSTQSLGVKWAPAGGGSTPVPATISDLVFWWEADDINITSTAVQIRRLQDRTPWQASAAATAAGNGYTLSGTPLNSLPILVSAFSSPFTLNNPSILPAGGTFFVVARATSAGTRALIGAATNGLSLYLDVSSGGVLTLVKTNTAIIGAESTGWSSGVAFQANVTYNISTGAFAFRRASAANGSGTGATGAGLTDATSFIGADGNVSSAQLSNCDIAAIIIYSRPLTAPEVASMEAYLLAKWGV